jgi:hypothetical protein
MHRLKLSMNFSLSDLPDDVQPDNKTTTVSVANIIINRFTQKISSIAIARLLKDNR